MTLASNRLKETRSPTVEKLWNSRIRVERHFEIRNQEDGYDSALGTFLFEDYPALDGAALPPGTPGEQEVKQNRAFTNARLVRQVIRPPAGADVSEPVLVKTYETLTNEFVVETPDATSFTQNGLEIRTRTLIGTPSAVFDGVVGDSTHPDNATLILAGFEMERTDAFHRLVARYAEPGVLNEQRTRVSEGVFQFQVTYLVEEVTPSEGFGPIISESIQNVEGLQTVQVTYLQDKEGNPLVVGDTQNLVHSFDRLIEFPLPGIADIATQDTNFKDANGTGRVARNYYIKLTAGNSIRVKARYFVFFQESDQIDPATDYQYDGAQGLWNPYPWASSDIRATRWSGFYGEFRPSGFVFSSQALSGYRVGVGGPISGTGPTSLELPPDPAVITVQGTIVSRDGVFYIALEGFNEDPIGKTYVLDVDLSPAFEDVEGNVYYKKTIIVATITDPNA